MIETTTTTDERAIEKRSLLNNNRPEMAAPKTRSSRPSIHQQQEKSALIARSSQTIVSRIMSMRSRRSDSMARPEMLDRSSGWWLPTSGAAP